MLGKRRVKRNLAPCAAQTGPAGAGSPTTDRRGHTHNRRAGSCDATAKRSVPVGSVGGSPAGSDATLTRRHTQIASLPPRRRWRLLAWWVGEWLRVPLAAGGTSRSSGLTILWKRLPPGGKKLVPTRAGRCWWWKAGPGRPTRTVQVQQSCACAYVARCVSKPRSGPGRRARRRTLGCWVGPRSVLHNEP